MVIIMFKTKNVRRIEKLLEIEVEIREKLDMIPEYGSEYSDESTDMVRKTLEYVLSLFEKSKEFHH